MQTCSIFAVGALIAGVTALLAVYLQRKKARLLYLRSRLKTSEDDLGLLRRRAGRRSGGKLAAEERGRILKKGACTPDAVEFSQPKNS
jgi:hypothetical protein